MDRARAASVRVILAGLFCLTACTQRATPPEPSQSGSSAVPLLANGQPLPSGCPGGDPQGHTVAFVASGNAWLLDPTSGDAICLFPTPEPGPFAWNPRGDRALLNGLEIRSVGGKELRDASVPGAPIASWGHPIGKAVVFISPNGRRLEKVYPGTQRHDDITPVPHVRYLNVVYHPSGLALAFVVDTGKRQEIWLSSNVGEDPVRLVFAVGATTFGSLAFTADGSTLLYAAVHGDDAPLLHALDLRDPTVNQGLWHGEPGQRISSVSPQPERSGDLVAFTVGSSCEDSRAMVFHRGEEAQPLVPAPSQVVGWLDADTVLVASDGCAGPSNLSAVNVGHDAAMPLVSGVELAAARTPLLGFVPALPQDIVQKVGSGVG
jgi:hypothetical protein